MIRSIRGTHVVLGLDGSRRFALDTGVSAADSYRQLPGVVDRATQRLLHMHGVGAVSVWLLQEYNLRRDPHTVDVLIDVALECIVRLQRICVSTELPLRLVGELPTVEQIRPGCLQAVIGRGPTPGGVVESRCSPTDSSRVHLMLGYNHDKEFVRALDRCKRAGIVAPSMGDLATRWCIPAVDVLIRTGQPAGMVNLSSYWPGLERGRIISTPLYPQQFTDDEIDRLIGLYVNGVDSSSATVSPAHH